MVKPVNIGAESFHELIESNSYYVDKTPFIRTVFQEINLKGSADNQTAKIRQNPHHVNLP